jgi:hypothetical protein
MVLNKVLNGELQYHGLRWGVGAHHSGSRSVESDTIVSIETSASA